MPNSEFMVTDRQVVDVELAVFVGQRRVGMIDDEPADMPNAQRYM